MVDVLREEFVQWVHIWLLSAKQHIVRKVLYNLGNEKKAPPQVSRRCSIKEPLDFGRHDGRTEKTQKDKGTNGRVLCVGKLRKNRS